MHNIFYNPDTMKVYSTEELMQMDFNNDVKVLMAPANTTVKDGYIVSKETKEPIIPIEPIIESNKHKKGISNRTNAIKETISIANRELKKQDENPWSDIKDYDNLNQKDYSIAKEYSKNEENDVLNLINRHTKDGMIDYERLSLDLLSLTENMFRIALFNVYNDLKDINKMNALFTYLNRNSNKNAFPYTFKFTENNKSFNDYLTNQGYLIEKNNKLTPSLKLFENEGKLLNDIYVNYLLSIYQ